MHKSKEDVSELFHEKFGTDENATPETIAHFVRKLLREKFQEADVGITGANFLIADTGSVRTIFSQSTHCNSRNRKGYSFLGRSTLVMALAGHTRDRPEGHGIQQYYFRAKAGKRYRRPGGDVCDPAG